MNRTTKKLTISEEKAVEKIIKFCAYRERCIHEVTEKLREWGINEKSFPTFLNYLQREKFLNEERYVNLFVKSKLNKGWGAKKISHHLAQKRITPQLIKAYLSKYIDNSYNEKMSLLANKKWSSLKDEDVNKKFEKTVRYLLSKGYESEAVFSIVRQINS